MPDLAPHHLLAVVCLLCIGLLAHWLDKRAQRRKASSAPRPGESRREHIERLARLRNWPKPPRPQQPLPGRMPTNPGPGLRSHPVYGTDTHRPWVIPPAELAEPNHVRGGGDCFNETVPGADWKPAGGEFGGAGASGSWDTPSTSSDASTSATCSQD